MTYKQERRIGSLNGAGKTKPTYCSLLPWDYYPSYSEMMAWCA